MSPPELPHEAGRARILNSTPGWESHGPEWGRHQPEVTQLEEGEPWPPDSVHQLVKLRSEPDLTGLPPPRQPKSAL